MSASPKKKDKLGLPAQMLIGLGAGVLLGFICQQFPSINPEWFKPLGDLFIRLIRMIVIPLVFCSIVSGATSMGSASKLGQIAVRCLVFFIGTTALAVIIGLTVANFSSPAAGIYLQTKESLSNAIAAPSIVDTLLNIIPLNPFEAMSTGNLLQVLFFALFFGFVLSVMGERVNLIKRLIDELNEVMITVTNIIMRLAPLGVFALITYTVGSFGLSILLPLIKLIAIVYFAALLHIILVYVPLVKLFTHLPLKTYFLIMAEPLLMAFTTCSSAAALPANMKAALNLGSTQEVTSFAVPLGTTVNMDGAALYLGIATIFVAEVYGISLGFSEQMTVLIMSLLASIGSVGVPGSALIVMTMVFAQVGLPMEGIALVAGIDRILDMARTTLNVMGDSTCAVVVSGSFKELKTTDFNKQVVK